MKITRISHRHLMDAGLTVDCADIVIAFAWLKVESFIDAIVAEDYEMIKHLYPKHVDFHLAVLLAFTTDNVTIFKLVTRHYPVPRNPSYDWYLLLESANTQNHKHMSRYIQNRIECAKRRRDSYFN